MFKTSRDVLNFEIPKISQRWPNNPVGMSFDLVSTSFWLLPFASRETITANSDQE
jgi:hypothetical protein